MVNPRQPRFGAAGDERQLAIIFLREALAQIGHLFPNQIGVIEQPLRRKRKGVVHLGRHRQTRVRPFQLALDLAQPAHKGWPARLHFTADRDRAREARRIFREPLTRGEFMTERSCA